MIATTAGRTQHAATPPVDQPEAHGQGRDDGDRHPPVLAHDDVVVQPRERARSPLHERATVVSTAQRSTATSPLANSATTGTTISSPPSEPGHITLVGDNVTGHRPGRSCHNIAAVTHRLWLMGRPGTAPELAE